MKNIPLLFFFAALSWHGSYCSSSDKVVAKRQSCSNGGCAPPPPAPIPAPLPIPCSGGNCGSSCSGQGCQYQPLPYQPLPYQPPPYQPPPYQPVPYQPSPCSGGRCGGTSCSGTGCNYPEPSPVRTCSSCVSGCSNRCSSNQCVNNCLGSCSCENERIVETPTNRCCDVLHPKNCFTDEAGSKRCVVRRHRECSDLCSSSVVSIQQREGGTTGCHYIRNYPYIYCGNYERQNCGQCFSCGGVYNPTGCSRRPECTQGCRDSIPNPLQSNGLGLN